MKKYKNLVIGGIQQKVFNLMLVTVILLVAAYTAVIVYQVVNLKKLTAETNLRQKEAIAEISGTTMDAVVADSLASRTEMSAKLADDLFAKLASTVRILADSAEDLLQSPELYPARPFALPDASLDGTITMQLVGETGGMPGDPATLEKLGLLANLSDLMTALYRNAGTSSVYIAVPEGYMLCVDDKSGARVDEQGNIRTIPIRERPWYLGAAQSDSIFFTDVLQDTFTGEIGITCTIPIRQNGRLVAVGICFWIRWQKRWPIPGMSYIIPVSSTTRATWSSPLRIRVRSAPEPLRRRTTCAPLNRRIWRLLSGRL